MGTLLSFESTNPIIVFYPTFAGGKFIGNCLSLSKNVLPMKKDCALYLMEHPTDYLYRLKCIMQTIPPKDNMDQWRDGIEFGDTEFYGIDFLDRWLSGKLDNTHILNNLLKKEFNFLITAHGNGHGLSQVAKILQNSTILILYNYQDFYNISLSLKGGNLSIDYLGNYRKEKYEDVLAGPSWPSWSEFNKSLFNVQFLSKSYDHVKQEIDYFYGGGNIKNKIVGFDMSTIFDQQLFLKEMQLLYTNMGYDDFNEKILKIFWESCIALHT